MRKTLLRMTLRQLQVFRAVCDHGSYSRAADEMALTQPAVSLQIRQLEELVGQPLFEYVGKKLYLTEAAEALKRAGSDIFGRLESLDMQLSDLQGSNPMVLHLSRGGFDPKEHRFLHSLVDAYLDFRVGYTRVALISTVPPFGLNLIALPTRLMSICFIMRPSANSRSVAGST